MASIKERKLNDTGHFYNVLRTDAAKHVLLGSQVD